jgi:uncharacterized protein
MADWRSVLRTEALTVPENIVVIRSFYDRLGLGDVSGLLALFAPEIEWTEAERFPYYGGTWRTPDAVVTGLLVPLGRDWSAFTARAADYVADSDHVVAFGSYAGTHRKTGRSFTAPFAHWWTLREGKITGFVQYTDTAKVIEALHD